MPLYNAISQVIDVFLSMVIVLLVYKSLASHLRNLLDKVIRLPEGTTFYMRAFILVLFCVVLSKVVAGIQLKPDAHFMEYVWEVGKDISGVFDNLFWTLLTYLGIVTLLVVVLKPKND